MQLNKEHDACEMKKNTEDVKTVIFEVEVPDKKVLELKDETLLVLDLVDDNGDQIDPSSIIEVAYKAPTHRNWREIHEKTYRPYANLRLDEQYSRDKKEQLRIKFDPSYMDFDEHYKIAILLESPDEIDDDNSVVEFEVDEFAKA